MSTPPADGGSAVTPGESGKSKDPDQIEADIAQHRVDLAQTVDELTERLDVKKQAQRKVALVRARYDDQLRNVATRAQNAEPGQITAVVAAALGVVVISVLVFRRARR